MGSRFMPRTLKPKALNRLRKPSLGFRVALMQVVCIEVRALFQLSATQDNSIATLSSLAYA